jgi:hypothetical protein
VFFFFFVLQNSYTNFHYQKFAKYQRLYRRNISIGNLRSELPTDTFPSVIQSVTTDGKFSVRNSVGNYRRKYSVGSYRLNYKRKSFRIKKKAGRWRGGFGGHFFPMTSPTDSKTTARTVMWPVRRLHYRRTHRGIWNGRSVRWRVYVSVRITDVITDWFTDGISVGETDG